ncbi:SurA N-terminal domain-containing protein [Acidobacteriota bacterium]
MNKSTKYISICLILMALAGMSYGQKVVEAIVAIVNNDVITVSEFKAQYDALYATMRAQTGGGEEFAKQWLDFKKTILENMITEKLLLQEGQKLGYNMEERFREYVDRLKEQNNITTDADFLRAIQGQGMTYEQFKKRIQENLLRETAISNEIRQSVVLDDAELVDYYKKHPEDFIDPAEYKIRAIYVSAEDKNADELEAKKKEIDRKLAAGEDMAAVAGELSEGPEKETSGDLGTMVSGEMAKELEDTVSTLQNGEMAPWLEFRGGWFRLKLEEKKESTLKVFEEARGQIEEKMYGELQQEKLQEYLKKLKDQSYIKILILNPEDLF